MRPNDYDAELADLVDRSTSRLLSAEVFDKGAFDALREKICSKAEALKAEYVISKQLLGCLRGAANAIRNQAPYVAAAQKNLALADEFELLLDILIAGEVCSDRTPGVPRIL